ncbi:MAG: GNAT family N-acetyltransferase [Elusimicrobia bacterium]|nr:GNAT family N-acetyltransferase [Elusimicrobiota bacterium]
MRISRTTKPADLRVCAGYMAAADPWLRLGRGYRACLAALRAPREVYAAREKGAIAGFIALQTYGVLNGYIQTVCVAPGWRGRGVGTALVRFAEKRILSKGPNVFMCVSSFNRGARRLYGRLGYEKAGLLKDFIIRGEDELLLRKTTGPRSEFAARRRN